MINIYIVFVVCFKLAHHTLNTTSSKIDETPVFVGDVHPLGFIFPTEMINKTMEKGNDSYRTGRLSFN